MGRNRPALTIRDLQAGLLSGNLGVHETGELGSLGTSADKSPSTFRRSSMGEARKGAQANTGSYLVDGSPYR